MAVLIKSLIFVSLTLLLLCPVRPAYAGEPLQLQEQEIKAGLLYNFLRYTDWPVNTMHSSSIVVCIFGGDPFQGYLQPMAGRSVNQKEIIIRPLRDIKDAESCQLLFINASSSSDWPQLQKFLVGKSVLTVSDFEGFARKGGMIEFGHRDDHISAEINMDAVTAAQLHVQDRMLKLVTVLHLERAVTP